MRETHRNKLKIYSQSQEREYIVYTLKRTNKAQVVDIRTVQLARSQRQRREENISIRTKTKSKTTPNKWVLIWLSSDLRISP